MAEVAGIMAAKKTADSLPLCHPLPLQSVRLSFELNDSDRSILVLCEAITSAQTGVEMEALAGVNGALLAIYDLSKAVDPTITLCDIRLDFKEGGKSGVWRHPDFQATAPDALAASHAAVPKTKILDGVCAAVLTISDRTFAGESEDRSGPRFASSCRVGARKSPPAASCPTRRSRSRPRFAE